jgi:hypothetical protein
MSQPLLLDEMFSDSIAQQLCGNGHDGLRSSCCGPSRTTSTCKPWPAIRRASNDSGGTLMSSGQHQSSIAVVG